MSQSESTPKSQIKTIVLSPKKPESNVTNTSVATNTTPQQQQRVKQKQNTPQQTPVNQSRPVVVITPSTQQLSTEKQSQNVSQPLTFKKSDQVLPTQQNKKPTVVITPHKTETKTTLSHKSSSTIAPQTQVLQNQAKPAVIVSSNQRISSVNSANPIIKQTHHTVNITPSQSKITKEKPIIQESSQPLKQSQSNVPQTKQRPQQQQQPVRSQLPPPPSQQQQHQSYQKPARSTYNAKPKSSTLDIPVSVVYINRQQAQGVVPDYKQTAHVKQPIQNVHTKQELSLIPSALTNNNNTTNNDNNNNTNKNEPKLRYQELKLDLFTLPSSYTLCHCIAQDAAMGAGIATLFVKKYPGIRLAVQSVRPRIGDVVPFSHPTDKQIHNVLNLITKAQSWKLPSRDGFEKTIQTLKEYCVANNIKQLGMPLLGAGLDRLDWGISSKFIQDVFSDVDIEICVCRID